MAIKVPNKVVTDTLMSHRQFLKQARSLFHIKKKIIESITQIYLSVLTSAIGASDHAHLALSPITPGSRHLNIPKRQVEVYRLIYFVWPNQLLRFVKDASLWRLTNV